MIFCNLACAPSLLKLLSWRTTWILSPEACFPVGPPPLCPHHSSSCVPCVYSRFSSFLSVGSAFFFLSIFPPLNFMLHVLSLPSSQFWWIHSKEWGVFPLFPMFVIAQWMNSVSMIFPVELGQLGASYHFSRSWSKAFCGYFLFPICLLLTAARYTFLKHNFGHRNFIICSGFGLKCNFSHTSECF